MAEIIEGVNPTRMDLLEIKERIKLATKGHKLLKEKRDSLVMEFFKIIGKSKESRRGLSEKLARAYKNMIIAKAFMSSDSVKEIAYSTPEKGEILISKSNIFGVEIPKIEFNKFERASGYETVFTSSKLDEAKRDFEEIFPILIKLAEYDEAMKRLGEEIKLTKRRVNALEYIMIPKLINTKKYIQSRLEELERENFFMLKRVKSKKFK